MGNLSSRKRKIEIRETDSDDGMESAAKRSRSSSADDMEVDEPSIYHGVDEKYHCRVELYSLNVDDVAELQVGTKAFLLRILTKPIKPFKGTSDPEILSTILF